MKIVLKDEEIQIVILGKWGLSHEAVLHKNPEFIKKVLMYRDFARAKNMVKTLKNLASSLVVTKYNDINISHKIHNLHIRINRIIVSK